jgi:hypothetical protein
MKAAELPITFEKNNMTSYENLKNTFFTQSPNMRLPLDALPLDYITP